MGPGPTGVRGRLAGVLLGRPAVFAARPVGYASGMAASDAKPGGTPSPDETTKPGPANPQGSGGLDAPTPPGGPLRSDSADGSVAPGGPGTPVQPGEPEEQKKAMRPVEEPVGDAGHATTTDDVNAQTSQGEPSDDSGSE